MDKISNWRYDLREVEGVPEDISNSKPTTDLKSKREVKEKTVNNKVTINPPLGDKMEGVIASMGGKLISISEEEIETEVDSKTKIKEGVLGSPGTKKLRSASDRSKNSMTDKDRKKQENIRKGRDILTDIQGTQKALDHEVGLDRRISRAKLKREEYEDRALSNVIASIRKGGGVMASDIPKPTDAQKAEWKAERARRVASRKSMADVVKSYRRAGESD